MDQLLHDLSGILVNALPTAFLVLVLAIYLKYMLFKPMDKVLDERYKLTDGARKAAEESSRNADARVSEYEAKLDAARREIYQSQEHFLRKLHLDQAEQIKTARSESERRVTEIKLGLAKDTEIARTALESQSETLATQIAESILNRRVA